MGVAAAAAAGDNPAAFFRAHGPFAAPSTSYSMRATLFLSALALVSSQLIVRTADGEVQGEEQDGVRIWRSIPFAAAPVGPLRFSPPTPPKPWSGVKDVRPFATPCPQLKLDGNLFYGGEDCLQLSVYARATPAPKPGLLPVLFWIYGGAYVLGDDEELGWYDGIALAKRHDMIFIGAFAGAAGSRRPPRAPSPPLSNHSTHNTHQRATTGWAPTASLRWTRSFPRTAPRATRACWTKLPRWSG